MIETVSSEPCRSKPRVGINAASYSGLKVGVNVVMVNLAAELASRWDILIYTSVPGAFQGLPLEVQTIPKWTQGQRGRMFWSYFMLPRLLQEDRVDLVLSPFSEGPIHSGIPAIAVIHDLTPLVLEDTAPLRYRIQFWISLQLLRWTPAIVTVSEHTRQDILRRRWYPAESVHVIHNGTRMGGFARGEHPYSGRPYILYVGGFLPHKNVPLLLSAFQTIAAKSPYALVLVGWAPKSVLQDLSSTIANLGLESKVVIESGLPDQELATLYAHCELFVFPSRYEGFGLPVLEAMACGAPVLCSNAASIPEVGGDAVMYFSPDSETELVAGIQRLLGDAELRRRMSREGRARAQLFTWSRAADAFSSLIDELLRRDVPGSTDPTGQSSIRPIR